MLIDNPAYIPLMQQSVCESIIEAWNTPLQSYRQFTWTVNTVIIEDIKIKLRNELQEIVSSCSCANWDDEGAEPISLTSINLAKKFVNFMDKSTPRGYFAPANNGDVVLTWQKNKYILAILFSTRNSAMVWSYKTPTQNTARTYSLNKDNVIELLEKAKELHQNG